MDEFLKALPGLGIGGILAAMIFFFYRKDLIENADRWKDIAREFQVLVKENTVANERVATSNKALQDAVQGLTQELRTTRTNAPR